MIRRNGAPPGAVVWLESQKPTADDRKQRMEFELCKLETRHEAGAYHECEDVYQVCRGAIVGKLAEIEFDRLAELAKG